MKASELVDIIHTLENNQTVVSSYEALGKLGYYDKRDDYLYSRTTGEPHNNHYVPRNIYNEEEIELLDSWVKILGEDNLSFTPFCERTFLRNFLANIPQNKQLEYIKNTNLYYSSNNQLADPQFVLVTRRTLPSIVDKPETFWSEEPTTTFWGLKNEIQGEQRAYSSIIVSTLKDLQEHGQQDIELLSSATSDGEIVTSSKPYPSSRILFAYKPIDEIASLIQTVCSSNKNYDEFLKEVMETMNRRYAEVNPTLRTTIIPEESSDSDDFDFTMDDWL